MTSQPRVAIVAASLDILGGQGVQADSLIACLRADGYGATLIAINPRFPRGLGWIRRVPYVRTLVNQALYVPSLLRLAAVDVAHVFSASYASFLLAPVSAMLVARLLNKRVVLHYHSGEADDHLANWGVLVHPWLKLAHEIVVPSEYLRSIFARYRHDARVIPNIVDLSHFRYRERNPIRPRLLSVRNLEPYYRVDVVLEAFGRFRAREPNAMLTVAGYGSEEPRLRRLAESVAGGAVQFVGKVDPDAMPRLYADADIFLNASVVDNQPVSILEAFAAGLPVVSTPTGDIQAMVRHAETGLIVPPNDPAAMASAVGAILDNQDRGRQMARRAHQELERHTWSSVRDQWAAVYARGVDRLPLPNYPIIRLPNS